MNETFKNENIKKFLYFLVVLALGYIIFKYVLGYFTPFILGYILCRALYPITKFLINNKVPKSLASLLTIALFLGVLYFLGETIFIEIFEQGKQLASQIPFYIESTKEVIENVKEIISMFLGGLPDSIKGIFYFVYESIIYFFKDLLGKGFKVGSLGVIKKVPNFFMILFISLISCFLMLSDKENIEQFVYDKIPKNIKMTLKKVKGGLFTALLGYIKAQLIIMLFIAFICFIGLKITGAPYALFLSFIISFVDALPVLGSGAILLPWGLYNLLTKGYDFAIGLFITYIIIVFTRQFIEHRIVGKQVGVHPLLILMSIYIGIKILGFLGVILGPMAVVVVKFLYEEKIISS